MFTIRNVKDQNKCDANSNVYVRKCKCTCKCNCNVVVMSTQFVIFSFIKKL